MRAPVATTHAVPGGVEERALAMAVIADPGLAAVSGLGRRSVPSMPDFPSVEMSVDRHGDF